MPWRRDPIASYTSPKEHPESANPEAFPDVLTALYLSKFTGRVTLILRGGKPSAIIRRGKATFLK